MKAIRIINKSFLYIYYLLRFKSHTVAYYFAQYNLKLFLAAKVFATRNKLVFAGTGNEILKKCIKSYINEYEKMVICLCDSRVKVVAATENNFTVNVNGINLMVNSISNIVTLYEIYIETLYKVTLPDTNNIVVMDIGMNVGYASLFFASFREVKKVYSYEPFSATYEEAQRNLNNNARLLSKINSYNFGISNYDGIIDVPMMTSGDGGASTNKDILQIRNTGDLPFVKVEIKEFINEARRIIKENRDASIVLKIDCEGEEYTIFDSIKSEDLLGKISVLIIEWHLKGDMPIVEILNQHFFKVLCLPKADNASGMIYAFK